MATRRSTSPGCTPGSDNQFGPQINIDCRPFDFTLLFEDIFFACCPASIFLVCLSIRLYSLRTVSVKVKSYKLAGTKVALISALFVLHVVYTVFQQRASALLWTRASLPSAALTIAATFTAGWLSVFEHRRSMTPSDLLVLYFSTMSLCSVPRLRSLWIIPSAYPCRYLWLSIFILTTLAGFAESASKTAITRPGSHVVATTAEQRSSFWNRGLFIWVLPFLRDGYSNIIQVEDIPEVDMSLQGQYSGERLKAAWDSVPSASHYRLIRAILSAYRWQCLYAVLPRLVLTVFTFAQPSLITGTLDYIQNTSSSPTSKSTGQALIGAYVLVYGGLAISKAIYWRQTLRLLTMMRSGLVSMIYVQTTGMASEALTDSDAITLMGTDVERIITNLRNVHETWASIIEVGIAVWLMEREVWIACIIPLVISLDLVLGVVLAMVPVSTKSGEAQKQWIERVQERLAVTSSMLSNMKTVKMLGLDAILFKSVSQLRQIEVGTSMRFRKLLIWQVALSNLPTTFAPFVTLTIYAIIALVRHDGSILSTTGFTTLALISLLTSPLLTFCQAMPANLQAVACLGRIQEYCLQDFQSPSNLFDDLHPEPNEKETCSDRPLISFNNASISWSRELEPTLKDLNVQIRRVITIIIGPVGCGKSSLLKSMINHRMLTRGSVTASFTKFAYCPQMPWIQNDTIRNNIIGASEFDQAWYDFTCAVSGLEADFRAVTDGDMRLAGSDGCSLSGGQKQRVALARAVYSKLDTVVLDNCFSGLDKKSISLIANRLFSKEGHFRQAGRSVILATTTYEMLPYADEIILLDQGRIVAKGSYDEIVAHNPEIALKVNPTHGDSAGSFIDHSSTTKDETQVQSREMPDDEQQQTKQLRLQGSFAVYGYYFRKGGYALLLLFLFFLTIEAFCTSFQTLWLQWWFGANSSAQLGMYLGVYGMLFGLVAVSIVAGCWLLFVRVLNNTSLNLHSDLLDATLRAPVKFFQTLDTGSTINRFSQDLELIDMMLPIYAVNFVSTSLTVLIDTIIICALGKYLASSIPFLGLVVFFLQLYYLRTSRQVRLLDIEAKAPLYTHFLETVHGISSIRSFGWEPQFLEKNQTLLNRSQRPMYMLFCIQQWLTLVLDLVVGGMAVVLIIIIVMLKDRFNAASIGVALNLLLRLNQTLAQAIKMWVMTETSIGAVTRIRQFVNETPSTLTTAIGHEPPSQPQLLKCPAQAAAVDFHNVTAGYGLSTDPTIRNISLSIRPGEKVAICGSSGSGKTSLIMAMLQLLDIRSGRITIDGRDIASMEHGSIHAVVNVISQEPFFLPGTLRFNMDPEQRVADERLIAAIRAVGLWGRVSENGGLDMPVVLSDWSVGQRQLLALARALIAQTPVLILDEATSSVDWETEEMMQSIIEKQFSQTTVLAVVHRFRYIDRFDRVALLRHGQLVEFDRPATLLERESEFRKLYSS